MLKNKRISKIVAAVLILAMIATGTFAWSSINQQALNPAHGHTTFFDVPLVGGGRLHDHFQVVEDWTHEEQVNKDIFVENFRGSYGWDPAHGTNGGFRPITEMTGGHSNFPGPRFDRIPNPDWTAGDDPEDEFIMALAAPIFARIRLTEFMMINGAPLVDDTYYDRFETWTPGLLRQVADDGTDGNATNAEDPLYAFWNWGIGGDSVAYIPTFNRNPDSRETDTRGAAIDPNWSDNDDTAIPHDHASTLSTRRAVERQWIREGTHVDPPTNHPLSPAAPNEWRFPAEAGGVSGASWNQGNHVAPTHNGEDWSRTGAAIAPVMQNQRTGAANAMPNSQGVISYAIWGGRVATFEATLTDTTVVDLAATAQETDEFGIETDEARDARLALEGAQIWGNFWIVDSDGWATWARPIPAGSSSGLLLDYIMLYDYYETLIADRNNRDIEWWYGIHVTSEMASASHWADMIDGPRGMTNQGRNIMSSLTGVPAPGYQLVDLPAELTVTVTVGESVRVTAPAGMTVTTHTVTDAAIATVLETPARWTVTGVADGTTVAHFYNGATRVATLNIIVEPIVTPPVEYAITWNANGAGVTGMPTEPVLAEAGSRFVMPAAPERPEYVFLGWATTIPVNVADLMQPGAQSPVINGPTEFFAVWGSDDYLNVNFVLGTPPANVNQSTAPTTLRVTSGATVAAPAAPTRTFTGTPAQTHGFQGWYTAPTGGVPFVFGTGGTQITANTNVYARWNIPTRAPIVVPDTDLFDAHNTWSIIGTLNLPVANPDTYIASRHAGSVGSVPLTDIFPAGTDLTGLTVTPVNPQFEPFWSIGTNRTGELAVLYDFMWTRNQLFGYLIEWAPIDSANVNFYIPVDIVLRLPNGSEVEMTVQTRMYGLLINIAL
ncbi:MAG: InlB B-repeat-containing protein [Oscillospiraceae bacterium]|nr:InlB B-repeat-containing protein [Oscillospiraceae bacterium]